MGRREERRRLPTKQTGADAVCRRRSRSRIRNYLQDPDPDPQFEFRIRIRKGSGIRFLLTNLSFYLITMFIYGENSTNGQRLYILSHQKFVKTVQ